MEIVDLPIKDGDFAEQTDLTEPQVGGWNGIYRQIFSENIPDVARGLGHLLGDFIKRSCRTIIENPPRSMRIVYCK